MTTAQIYSNNNNQFQTRSDMSFYALHWLKFNPSPNVPWVKYTKKSAQLCIMFTEDLRSGK